MPAESCFSTKRWQSENWRLQICVKPKTKNHWEKPASRRSKNRSLGGRLGDRFRWSTNRSPQMASPVRDTFSPFSLSTIKLRLVAVVYVCTYSVITFYNSDDTLDSFLVPVAGTSWLVLVTGQCVILFTARFLLHAPVAGARLNMFSSCQQLAPEIGAGNRRPKTGQCVISVRK